MNRLRMLRTVRGFSLEELSNMSGIPVKTLTDIENGKEVIINTREVVKLSESFGVKPSDIFS